MVQTLMLSRHLLASSAVLTLASRSAIADGPISFAVRRMDADFDPSTMPTQCSEDNTGCRTISSCQTIDCRCTDAMAVNMKSCSECLLKLDLPVFNETTADIAAMTYTEGCKAAGKPVAIDAASGSSSSIDDKKDNNNITKPNDGAQMGSGILGALVVILAAFVLV